MKKNILAALLALFFFTCGTTTALASDRDVILYLNSTKAINAGTEMVLPTAPFVEKGVTMLPLRVVCEEILGGVVNYDGVNKQVEVAANGSRLTLYLVSGKVVAQGKEYAMPASPKVVGNYTYVPLRLLAELLNCTVDYSGTEKKITVTPPAEQEGGTQNPAVQKPVAGVYFNTVTRGQKLDYYDESRDPGGLELVAHKWKVITPNGVLPTTNLQATIDSLPVGTYTVKMAVQNSAGLWSDWTEGILTTIANNPPQVKNLVLSKPLSVNPAIGNEVDFSYRVENEVWEDITEEKWSYSWTENGVQRTVNGKPRAFFSDDRYTVTLMVKDAVGNWSEPASLRVAVTSGVSSSEAQFRFSNILLGETYLNLKNINFNQLATAQTLSFDKLPVKLLSSNNPEKILQHGILYSDTVQGDAILHYHHTNGMSEHVQVNIILYNPNPEAITVRLGHHGEAGPSWDIMQVGQKAAEYYITSSPDEGEIILEPYQSVLVNTDDIAIKSGDTVTGFYDFSTDSQMQILICAMSPTASIDDYKYLNQLSKASVHARGTFDDAKFNIAVKFSGKEAEKIIIGRADALSDYFVTGVDAPTGEKVVNNGNYGIWQTITVTAPVDMGLLLNPRGITYKGVLVFDGEVCNVYSTYNKADSFHRTAGVVGYLKAGQTHTISYITPDGSDAPVLLVAIPKNQWPNF